MGRIIKSHDDLPVREYMNFLKQFNRMNDCSWFWPYDHHENRDRFENWELEMLRNQSGGVIYTEEDFGKHSIATTRSRFTASQTRLAIHRFEKKKRKAV